MHRLLRATLRHHSDVPLRMIRQLRSGSPAPGGSTLDHLGPEVGEDASGERPGNQLTHLQHPDPVEGPGGLVVRHVAGYRDVPNAGGASSSAHR